MSISGPFVSFSRLGFPFICVYGHCQDGQSVVTYNGFDDKEFRVRIREFVTRFTRFSLEIRKTILFSFRVFSKKSKKRIKRKNGRKHLEDARGCYYGDARGYLACIG